MRYGPFSHATVVTLGAAAFLVLVFGAALEVRRILTERDRAHREAEASRRVSDFVTSMFRVPDPSEARGSTVTGSGV